MEFMDLESITSATTEGLCKERERAMYHLEMLERYNTAPDAPELYSYLEKVVRAIRVELETRKA